MSVRISDDDRERHRGHEALQLVQRIGGIQVEQLSDLCEARSAPTLVLSLAILQLRIPIKCLAAVFLMYSMSLP